MAPSRGTHVQQPSPEVRSHLPNRRLERHPAPVPRHLVSLRQGRQGPEGQPRWSHPLLEARRRSGLRDRDGGQLMAVPGHFEANGTITLAGVDQAGEAMAAKARRIN